MFKNNAEHRLTSSHGEGLGADLQREDFSRYHPRDRAPGACEEEDVDADECNQGALGNEVLNADTGANTSDDELADGHANGAWR